MSWRIVYVSNQCHLSFKNNYLVCKSEETRMIHLSEINTLIIDNNLSSVSIYLLNELVKEKIKIIICDEKHNPAFEIMPYYGSFDTSEKIANEINWNKETLDNAWQKIIRYKIIYQSKVLEIANKDAHKLVEYSKEVLPGDTTNREGHAAKVYFNSLFGNSFSRDDDDNNINSYLNYGYSILLSSVNRAVTSCGYVTQIGIHHKGYNNPFNLSCDLMEIFRPIVDLFTYINFDGKPLDSEKKMQIVDILNSRYEYLGKEHYLTNVIETYTRKILNGIMENNVEERLFVYDYKKE